MGEKIVAENPLATLIRINPSQVDASVEKVAGEAISVQMGALGALKAIEGRLHPEKAFSDAFADEIRLT